MPFPATFLLVLFLATIFRSESFVHTARVDGVSRIVDSEGNRLYIRGVQLEGWLQVTANFWADYGLVAETHVYEGIRDVIGNTLLEEFRESVQDVHMQLQNADIRKVTQDSLSVIRFRRRYHPEPGLFDRYGGICNQSVTLKRQFCRQTRDKTGILI